MIFFLIKHTEIRSKDILNNLPFWVLWFEKKIFVLTGLGWYLAPWILINGSESGSGSRKPKRCRSIAPIHHWYCCQSSIALNWFETHLKITLTILLIKINSDWIQERVVSVNQHWSIPFSWRTCILTGT